MNVLIIELGGSHIECVHSFVHYLKIKEHNVHLACNKKLLNQFPEKERLSGILPLYDEYNLFRQLKTFLQLSSYIKKNKIDTLIINTTELKLVRNFSFFIPKKMNCIGLVHNAKKLEKSSTFENILSRKIRKYFVLTDFLLHNTKVNRLFEAHSFYPVYFPKPERCEIEKKENEFHIVVPGEVNQFRRDYAGLVKLIKNNESLQKIKFIFLGKDMLDENVIKKSDSSFKNIITFSEQVGYDTFHCHMQLCDAVLPLIKIQDDTMYGNSRISGSFNLGWGYKKPFLLPSTLKNNFDISPFSLYYDDLNELSEIVEKISFSKTEINNISKAYQNSKFDDIEMLAEETCEFIFKKTKQ